MKKKKRDKVELDISHLINDCIDLLDYESYIDYKIQKGIPLTDKEYFFHNYFISPSLLVKLIFKL